MNAGLHRVFQRRGAMICCALALLLIPVGIYFLNAYWPYRYRRVEPTLENVFASQIKIEHYHRTYWPHPGFVADGLTLRRNTAQDLPPVGSMRRVRVVGSWIDLLLLRDRIGAVYADGLHVAIPAVGSEANKQDFPPGSSNDFEGPTTAVERFVVEGALLDIMRTNGSRYSFPIKRLVMTNLQKNAAAGYTVEMETPNASGHIVATGSFGPVIGGKLEQTPVTGKFTYDDVKLDGVSDLHGLLRSAGRFHGNLAGIEAQAESSVANFSVGKGRGVALSGSSSGAVDALNGDIQLHSVDLRLGKTVVHVVGQLVGGPKVTDLDVSIAKGRVQDVLQPFMKANPPMVGPVRMHAHAHIGGARNGEKFLDRLTMKGVFEIPSERLTSAATEKSLSAFSERAQGTAKDAATSAGEEQDVMSSVVGAVTITKGVAHASQLVFEVPGASVEANGTFDLRSEKVDMIGDLRMQTDLSHVTTGFKSFLLKPLAPFFRKKHAGAVVPIRITGGPGQYKVDQNVLPR
jgi:hypothetical protein